MKFTSFNTVDRFQLYVLFKHFNETIYLNEIFLSSANVQSQLLKSINIKQTVRVRAHLTKLGMIRREKFTHYDSTRYRYMFDIASINKLCNTNFVAEHYKNLLTQLLSNSLEQTLRNLPRDQATCAILARAAYGYTNLHDRHFTINKNGIMTYLPAKRHAFLGDGWNTKNRQDIRYGKGIRKMLGEYSQFVTDYEVEHLANELKALFVFDPTFKLVEGADILEYYHEDAYNRKISVLMNSCMRYDECQDYLDFYAKNANKVKLLIALQPDGTLVGRALIWYPENTEEVYMDRIYSSDAGIQAFKNYASERGWFYKEAQSYDNPNFVAPNGSVFRPDDITITMKTNSTYPYMDTFKYGTVEGDFIYLNVNDGDHRLTCTEGNRGVSGDVFCQYLEEYIDVDDAVQLHNGDYMHHSYAVYLTDREEYYYEDDHDVVYIDYLDAYYHRDNTCFHDGQYYADEFECEVTNQTVPIRYFATNESPSFVYDQRIISQQLEDYITLIEAQNNES